MDYQKILAELCETDGVSGFEGHAAEKVKQLLAPYCDTVEIDRFHSVTGWKGCGKAGAKTLLLDAHIDQIGFIVTQVLEGGFLRFQEVGGVDPRMLLGAEVEILTETPIYGVIACMPPHLLKAGEENKAVPISEMVIDTGFLDAKDKIPVGTPVVFGESVCSFTKGSLTGKCLDDRAGILAILQTLEKIKDCQLEVNLAILASCQEETTSLGAGTGVFRQKPDYAIAIDVSHAKTPDAPGDKTFEYGGGVMIGMGPNMSRDMTQRLIKLARAEEIPYQLEVMEGFTGTNAWVMQVTGAGVATALLSIPLRYMHTPIESVKMEDIGAVSDLLCHYIKNLEVLL